MSLEMDLIMYDTETGLRYRVNISTVSFAFPGLKTGGERLEAFIKRDDKRVKYGEFQELTSLVLRNGVLEMVNW